MNKEIIDNLVEVLEMHLTDRYSEIDDEPANAFPIIDLWVETVRCLDWKQESTPKRLALRVTENMFHPTSYTFSEIAQHIRSKF